MSNFYAQYPASSGGGGGGSNASVGVNGDPAPDSSTQIGSVDSFGNLLPLAITTDGVLLVQDPAVEDSLAVINTKLDDQATADKQDIGNAYLNDIDGQVNTVASNTTSIDNKTPALGQALAAGSVPVVLTAAQAAALAPLSSVTVTQATGTNLHAVIDSSALPALAATSTIQATQQTSLSSIDTKTPALGQALAAASVPVVLTAAQLSTLTPLSSVTVTQATGTNLHAVLDAGSAIVGKVGIDQTTPGTTNGVVVNSSALPTGAATETTLAAASAKLPATLGQKAMAASMAVVVASDQSNLPANIAQINGVTPLMGNGVTGTGSMRVTLASDTSSNTNPFLTSETVSASSAVTSVASSASSVSLLASNSSRKMAMFFNDSTAILYLKFGTTASTSSYTVQIPAGGYYELPNGKVYTGAIDGIWSSANGNARITELS